ncbi:patatin-like phospholipase family protein [Pseudahrensia aquimaris]|uniref:Patatin-like phospholipase family protein n=1 Tax=Pseudahrensia aquimaris TaxID=744461 RepID=A0ABW3FJB6_9HYPH
MRLDICLRWLCLSAAVLFLAACVGRPAENSSIRNINPMEAVALDDPAVMPVAAQTRANFAPDNSFDILALSGGGAYGAYGAGVLSGWTQRGTRPQFDVVTGVSTGALMSVLAFLGPRYDELLRELYTETKAGDIFIDKGLKGLFTDSLYDNSPLQRQIERVVTPQLIADIAREHAKGRRLYVATTNLDAGQLIVWDMGEIASGGRTNPELHFRKVLRASAAVPGFFPPVYIKPQRGVQLRQAHVDGGVKAPVLLADFLFRVPQKNKNLYVIVNDSLSADDPVEPIDGNLASIARKSISTLTRQLLIQTVYRGYARASNSGTKFHLASVPDSLGQGNTSLEFNREQMRKLYEAGRQQALAPSPWLSRPPNIRTYDVSRR